VRDGLADHGGAGTLEGNIKDVRKLSQRRGHSDRHGNGEIRRFQAFPGPCLRASSEGYLL
jgi:hypothetical protein